MAESFIEEGFVTTASRTADDRLDVLRRRANYLERRLATSVVERHHERHEYAALCWAIAELAGIGDELRSEAAQRQTIKAGELRRTVKRAEHAEALNVQFRIKVDALKGEVYRLSRLIGTAGLAP